MKKLLPLFLALVLIGVSLGTKADAEIIDLVPIPTEVPEAIPDPRPIVINEYELDKKDVEKLARLLWSSPLRYEKYKKALVWVVMNRAEYGEPFSDSVQECINTTEFRFFDSHAHRSEENIAIVKQAMNEWYSRKDGNNVGEKIPLNAYYVSFYGTNNRRMQLLDIDKNVIDWNPLG